MHIRTGKRGMSKNSHGNMGLSKEVMTAHGFRAMARPIIEDVLVEWVDLIEHHLSHAGKDPKGRTTFARRICLHGRK